MTAHASGEDGRNVTLTGGSKVSLAIVVSLLGFLGTIGGNALVIFFWADGHYQTRSAADQEKAASDKQSAAVVQLVNQQYAFLTQQINDLKLDIRDLRSAVDGKERGK